MTTAALLNKKSSTYKTNRLFPVAGLNRGIGLSTGQALGYIAQAILTPNRWIVVIDHIGTPAANKALMFMCKTLVAEMGLKYFAFEFKQSDGTARIRCDIFGE